MFRKLLSGLLCLYGTFCFSQEAELAVGPDTVIVPPAFPDSAQLNAPFNVQVRDNSRVILSWRSLSTANEFFSIERSSNGKDFETIGVIKYSPAVEKLEWTDEQPAKGRNSYRIRYSFVSGVQWYSKTVTALVSGQVSFRFYPNPADELLIIRTEQPIDITIIDGAGKARISQSLQAGLQTLNVSALEKGIYLLRVYNRQTNTNQQERLVKN